MNKKTKLKQQKIPYHYKPEHMTYDEWQIALRRQFALNQIFSIKNIGDHPVYSDFEVYNKNTKRTYKVAIRSENIGMNYCSCRDFTINTLGTCKHIEYILNKLKKNRETKKLFKNQPEKSYSSVFIRYEKERKVFLRIGTLKSQEIKKLSGSYFNSNNLLLNNAFDNFDNFIKEVIKIDPNFRFYKDAIDYIIEVRDSRHRKMVIGSKYPEGINSPRFDSLLKVSLYPYQREAVLFSAQAGRSINADDMGLGKTIQAIAVAEIMAQEFGIEKVLIVCPTSLKYQWKSEIEKFSDRSSLVIEGFPHIRKEQYKHPEFFKIITYNVVQNDLKEIEALAPDLVILDEAQRIKNWNTKTAQSAKLVPSTYALVLTGTPIENKLEELHSITEFVDRYKLGPLFRFLADHQIKDERGKVVGYQKLNEISKTLSSIIIRRTKKEVLKDLPIRTDKNYFVPMTEKQMELHDEYYSSVCRLVDKWRRFRYLSDKERQILLINLNCMRMVSDSTFILDQKTRHDTKISELLTLLLEIFESSKDKVVVFSQWERMTRLIAIELEKQNIGFQYLHGGVPSPQRKILLKNFHENPHSLVFLSTDAGGLGLNLQCANTVINMDCPWNPAVLEQRIGRVYRLGQKKPVSIINFISKGTIEENMLTTLKFKKSIFEGVLDNGNDEVFMGESKFKQFMKSIEKLTEPAPKTTESIKEIKIEKEKFEKEKETKREFVSAPEKPTSIKHEEAGEFQDIFSTGLVFLEKLSKVVSNASSKENIISSLIEKDEKTGKKCLKIPIPNDALVEKVISTFSDILNMFKKE